MFTESMYMTGIRHGKDAAHEEFEEVRGILERQNQRLEEENERLRLLDTKFKSLVGNVQGWRAGHGDIPPPDGQEVANSLMGHIEAIAAVVDAAPQSKSQRRPPPGHPEIRYFDGTYCSFLDCAQHERQGYYHRDGRRCEGFRHRLKCGRW